MFTLSMPQNAPSQPPRPTDQGQSSLCTRHAMGNAVVSAGEKQGVNFPLKSAIDVLVNAGDVPNVEEGAYPEDFNTSKLGKPFVLQDESTKIWWYVEIRAAKCSKSDYNNLDQFVLVYNAFRGGGRHCVFIEKQERNRYVCINSWGEAKEPTPRIDIDKDGNEIYKVTITLRDSRLKDIAAAVKDAFESGGEEAVRKLTEENLDQWRLRKVKFAVTGGSGVGKSTFINTLRGIRANDPKAAKIGVTETTIKPCIYDFPENPNIKVCDFPGVGTEKFPKDEYFKKIDEIFEQTGEGIKVDDFDAYIVLSASRFTENDHFIAKHVHDLGKPILFARTKVDQDFENNLRDQISRTDDMLAAIRNDCEGNLQRIENKELYLISARFEHRNKWDYEMLYSRIIDTLSDLQKEAFLLSIQVATEEMVKEKVKVLQGRIPWINYAWYAVVYGPAVLVSLPALAGIMTSHIPAKVGGMAGAVGLKEAGDICLMAAEKLNDRSKKLGASGLEATVGKIIKGEVMFQRKQLGIDEKSIDILALETGNTKEEIMEILDISNGPRSDYRKSVTRRACEPYPFWWEAVLIKELDFNEASTIKKLDLAKRQHKEKM